MDLAFVVVAKCNVYSKQHQREYRQSNSWIHKCIYIWYVGRHLQLYGV